MTGTSKGRSLAALLLVTLLVAVGLTGCGGDDQATTELSSPTAGAQVEVLPVAATTTTAPLSYDALSTFESKDPFVPKVVEVTQSSSSATTVPGSPTTTAAPTTTTTVGTTPTTAPQQPTTTTTLAPPLHSLKVMSIETYSGQPVVTFKVDGVTYQSKREGDIVATSWGQIKVIDVDPDAAEVVFLHGSEIRVLKVGQEYLK
jgi:hypothetical protein